MRLTGSQRCAVFLLAVGEEAAADMLGNMERQEVLRITEAMAHLPHVPEACVRDILREARTFWEVRTKGIGADRELAGRLLTHRLGERDAREAMHDWGPDEQIRPFETLERMRPGQLYQLLRQEHPQTLALILGHLSASQAAGLLMRLPTDMRSRLLERIGGLEPVDEDILRDMDSVLARQAVDAAGADWRPGLQLAAEIVTAAGAGAGKELLAALEREGSLLPGLLGRMVHSPEDCLQLDDGLLREALEESPALELAAVLGCCGAETRAAFMAYLPGSQRASVARLCEEGGPDVQADGLRECVLRRVRRLQAERMQADLDAARGAVLRS